MPVTGDTQTDHGGIPQNSVIVPGNPTPVLMRGSTNVSTDNNQNTTTPVSFNLEQIGEIIFTLGQKIKDGSISVAIASDQIVSTLDARHADTFSPSPVAISAATTFSAIPLVSDLALNSYATLPNASYQDTFIAQIKVASAFIGTIAFYGLEPDGVTLQSINAHQRASATNAMSSAINTGAALNQTWEGSIAAFKAIYVVCTTFTSGAATLWLGLTAANYAHAIINTVSSNLTQLNGTGLSNANPLPSQDIEQPGYIAASGTPPTATNAGTNTVYTFSQQVNRITIQNRSSVTLNFDFDQAATAGSFEVPPGGLLAFPKKTTVINMLTASAVNINGSTAGNIVLRGSM